MKRNLHLSPPSCFSAFSAPFFPLWLFSWFPCFPGSTSLRLLLLTVSCAVFCFAGRCDYDDDGTFSQVTCDGDFMLAKFKNLDDGTYVYLQNQMFLHDGSCRPSIDSEGDVLYNISIKGNPSCGVQRIVNNLKRTSTFVHHVILECSSSDSSSSSKRDRDSGDGDISSSSINDSDTKASSKGKRVIKLIRCTRPNIDYQNEVEIKRISRRSTLPNGFDEQDSVIDAVTAIEENAPEPQLIVSVRQGTTVLTNDLNVKPGTPLTMQISLDEKSAPIYGLLMNYMHVSDAKSHKETIIFNGCSVDPLLFGNFNTVDGDVLTAKFKAFKFPSSSFVQFTGTVNVCLDKCISMDCGNGQVGYGRKRKKRATISHHNNNRPLFEITLTTYVNVGGFSSDD